MAYSSFEDLEPLHIHIAKGSAAELRIQTYIAQQIGLMDEAISKKMVAELKELSAMLQSLSKSLKTEKFNNLTTYIKEFYA